MRSALLGLLALLMIMMSGCFVRAPYHHGAPPPPPGHHGGGHYRQNCQTICAHWGWRSPCHGCQAQRVCLRNETRCN